MRWAFLNPSGPRVPDLDKAQRYGITRLYWLTTDPNLTAALMENLAPKIELGIMNDGAQAAGSAVDLARTMDAALAKIKRGGYGVQCSVLFDVEYPHHDPQYLLDLMHEWRALRPWRDTQWSPEFHQGGWFSSSLVDTINRDTNLAVLPQAYIGDPPIVQDADLTRCDITARGVNKDRVGVFYLAGDVAHRETWDGIVFRFDQLP